MSILFVVLRGLAIAEKALAAEHPDDSTLLLALTDLHRIQGRYVEAEAPMQTIAEHRGEGIRPNERTRSQLAR